MQGAHSYQGIRFESKAAAQWAVFLDALGIVWTHSQDALGAVFTLPHPPLTFLVCSERMWGGEVLAVDGTLSYPGLPVYVLGPPANPETTWNGEQRPTRHLEAEKLLPFADLHGMEDEQSRPSGWGERLCCPVCGDTYVHLEDAINAVSDDTWGSAWAGRGDAVRIPMSCERGHAWVLRYGFHKGQVYRAFEDATLCEWDEDFTLWLANWDETKRDAALATAHATALGRKLPPSLRFRVLKRDSYRCQLCGRSAADDVRLEVDHKVPWARGGGNDIANLWVLCAECNAGKSDHAL